MMIVLYFLACKVNSSISMAKFFSFIGDVWNIKLIFAVAVLVLSLDDRYFICPSLTLGHASYHEPIFSCCFPVLN